MGLFDEIKEEQEVSVATKDQKGSDSNRARYFESPKDMKGNAIEQFKPVAGVNKIDILPFYFQGGVIPAKSAGKVGTRLDLQIYKNVGPSNSEVLSLTQLMKDDPIANEYENLKATQATLATKDEKDKFYNAKMKPLRAQKRCIYLVLHHTDGKKVLKWFNASHFAFQKAMDDEIEKQDQLGNPVGIVADPVTGKTVVIFGEDSTFKSSNGPVEYVGIKSVSFIDRDKQIADSEERAIEIMTNLPKLDAFLTPKTTEEVETLFYGAPLQKEAPAEEGLNISSPSIEIPETGMAKEEVAEETPAGDSGSVEDDYPF